ncbi:MAG: binary toxin-like calcium binding domain-containing protein [Verrucomicrobiia bacterium]
MTTTRFTPSIPALVSVLAWCAAAGLADRVKAENIAPFGTGIIGVNAAVNSEAGTAYTNAGTAANVNDNDIGTRVDTWWGVGTTDQGRPFSYVGVLWPSKRFERINSLKLTLATFYDGGWFGTRSIGPAPGGPLESQHLIEPTIQVTTDGGVTWNNAAHTSDYLSVMNGHLIGGGDNINPSFVTTEFTLSTPATEVDGIRIIGENGGAADGNGFLGVFELEIEADPSSDSDGDGLQDSWEEANGLNVGTNDAALDPDGDGLTNLEEFNAGSNPKQADTDGDGLSDGAEVKTHQTSPVLADTDGDGLNDGREVNQTKSDPLLTDSDQDGLSDFAEVETIRSNPLLPDTDGDGFDDAAEVAQGSDPLNSGSVPTNTALFGRGLMGTKESMDSGPETEVELYHVGTAENINDGNLTTRVDTYNESTPGEVSFVGILWDSPVSDIVRLELTFATFYDGGWFGPNGTGPGSGGNLTPNHLTEPRVETSLDGGASWTPVGHTSDYLTALNGHGVGGGLNPNPSTVKAIFTLNQPANGITGIRIIGTEGGTASGGFLGVFELAVHMQGASDTDTDNDGMDDAWERQNGLVVGTNDAASDPDNDGLSNEREFAEETNPQVADTDNDGLNDGAEVNQHKSNPKQADTDGDGLNDGQEVNTTKTDPTKADTDGDGYSDTAEVNLGSNPNSASSIPTNLALLGQGILGTRETADGGAETPVFNAGGAVNIIDGNPTTRVDTYNLGSTHTASFVGVLWDAPIAVSVVRLELSLAIFFDGGWFGVNNTGPGTGGLLNAAEYLVEPHVEVTRNKGASWDAVGHTSDYLTALEGHPLPTVDYGAPTLAKATFQLTPAQTGIDGIRIIGSEGGTASSGFLGVFELAAHTDAPPPSSDILLANVARTATSIQFSFETQAGKNYVVQFSPSLSPATWQTLSTIAGDGTPKQVTDVIAGAQKFYRVMAP